MEDPFTYSLAFVLKQEGGLVNNPDDPGGLTNFGITERDHPDEDIANLSRKRVEQIYREHYWNVIEGDKLPPELAFVMLDYAVNCGPPRAIMDLQTAVHAKRDGVMGPKTLHALSFYAVPFLVEQVLQSRLRLYLRLARRNRYSTFLDGWLKRLVACAVRWRTL